MEEEGSLAATLLVRLFYVGLSARLTLLAGSALGLLGRGLGLLAAALATRSLVAHRQAPSLLETRTRA
jgi:hypothetical protein